MPEYGYSMQLPKGEEAKFAKAQLYDIDASYKDLGQVCANIKGLSVEEAEALLGKVSRGEFPIWFKKHNKKMGHRGEIGGKKGRYPMKCARIVLQVLKNAIANANNKGLLGELKVVHAAANKQNIYPRVAPRGRWRRSNYVTSRVEIILKEVAEAKPEEKAKKKEALSRKAEAKRKAREEAEKAAAEAKKAGEAEAKPVKEAASAEEKKAEKALERTSMEQG